MSKPEESSAFQIMEREDESQIEKEIRGSFLEKMVYSFQQGGREVTGLSYVGIKEVARRQGHIKISDVQIIETETHFRVVCKATDEINRLEMMGVSSQPKLMTTLKGQIPDEFALQKAMSKAQRNAIRAVIPESFIIACVEEFKKKGSTLNPLKPDGSKT